MKTKWRHNGFDFHSANGAARNSHFLEKTAFLFLCIGIGVGSIIALRSVIHNLNDALASEARTLLAADVQIDSTRPWLPETVAAIDRVSTGQLVTGRTETIESPTMVRPSAADQEGALMIELKGIDPPFPLYGDFMLANAQPFNHSLLAGNGAIVAPLLLERLNLRVGDQIRIGTSDFEIRGVLEREPGSSSGFRLGPRVYIARGAVEEAGLTGFGSRARRRVLLRAAPGEMENLVTTLRTELKGTTAASVRSYKESQDNLRDQFSRAENYLSLTGLVVLVLGGIGVSNVTRVFIEQKRRAIAILKCVGGTGRQISAVYLLQMLALGAAGSLFGVVLAKISLIAVAAYFSQTLPPNMNYGLQTGAVMQGLAMGLLTSLLFSAIPLLRIRHIKPRLLLRESDGITGPQSGFDLRLWVTAVIVAIGLILVAAWQAGSLRIGFFFGRTGAHRGRALCGGGAFDLPRQTRETHQLLSAPAGR
ncbi:MAG: FtsX-like permease family protein [Pyrinomonadaceae bacterium]